MGSALHLTHILIPSFVSQGADECYRAFAAEAPKWGHDPK